MASGSQSSGEVLCRYFSSNCCFKGELCPFSHDWKHKPDMRCKYYLRGSCINGKNCRYDHVKEDGREGLTNNTTHHTVGRTQVRTASGPANLPSLSSTDTHHKKMVTLHEDPTRNPKKWVQAMEFVPGKPFHDQAVDTVAGITVAAAPVKQERSTASPMATYSGILGYGLEKFLDVISPEEASSLLCPFAEMGLCPFDQCEYLHGDVCDMCNRQCLNPFDVEQQKTHQKECLKMHEEEMEKAFQIQESEGKQCAVCMECIVTKPVKSERRFGILANCDHCFCLNCIRKWRGSTHTENKTIRACPLCRKISYFVIPSEVWLDDEDQKMKLIQNYKDNLGKKHCKYFNMGEGTCPFGFSCFYKHEFPDGRKAENVPRFCEDGGGERKVVKTSTLWDYVNRREENSLLSGGVTPDNEPSNELTNTDQDLFWLNFEPEMDELDFL